VTTRDSLPPATRKPSLVDREGVGGPTFEEAVSACDVKQHRAVGGHPANLIYMTQNAQGEPFQFYRALFLQELIRGRELAPSFVVNYSPWHTHIDETIDATVSALRVHVRALRPASSAGWLVAR